MNKFNSQFSKRSANPVTKQLKRRERLPVALVFLGLVTITSEALATPTGGVVVGGNGTITQNGANTTVNQTSRNLALNWQTFNLGTGDSVQFVQPSFSSVALNRILDQNPSQIFGNISSNGQVFLINTHGIIFGASSTVNVGGLVASTLDLTPTDFLKRRYSLDAHGNSAGIVNHGLIQAASGGSISLIGGQVINDGLIMANYGRINLDAADRAFLDFDGHGLIKIEVTGELKNRLDASEAAVVNKGELHSEGGTVVLQASAAKGLFDNLVNNSGIIDAGGFSTDGGVVQLIAKGGNTLNSGTIDATGERGGKIQVLSDKDVLITGGSLDASGRKGGGEILIGGDRAGLNPLVQNADRTWIGKDVTIKADAIDRGNGGKIIIWSDHDTRYWGDVSALGGEHAGNGGFVEISGKENLAYRGEVHLQARKGLGGTLLLDPQTITIIDSGGGGNNGIDTNNGTINFDDGAANASFTITDEALESVGSTVNILLQATEDIIVSAGLSGGLTLAQTAGRSVAFEAGRSITVGSSISTAGGSLALRAGTGFNVANPANPAGAITVASGLTLSTNGGAITLTTNAATGGINTSGATLNSSGSTAVGASLTGGAVTVSSGGALNIGTILATGVDGGLAAGANGGAVSLTSSAGSVLSTTIDTSGGDSIGVGTAGGNAGNVVLSAATTVGNTSITASGGTALLPVGNGANGSATASGTAITLGAHTVGDLTVNGTGAVNLGSGAVTGNLVANAVGAVTQAGALTVTGTSGINAGAGTITLTNAANDFGGAVSLTNTGANNVAITDVDDLTLGNVSVGTGTLNVTAVGIAQAAGTTIVQAAAAGAANFSGGAGAIALANTNNNFTGAVGLSNTGANNVAIRDQDALILGNVAVGTGTLGVNAVGITQAAGTTIVQAGSAGAASFDSGTGALTLANTGNDFTGGVNLTGAGVSVRDNTALSVLTLNNAANTLVDLRAVGQLTLAAGITDINTGTADLTLSSGGTLSTQGDLAGNNVSLTGTNGVALGGNDVAATGNLSLTSTTVGISQGAGSVVTAGGTSTISAGAGVIALGNTANDFGGAVSLSNSGNNNVSIADVDDIVLGTSTLGTGTLTVSAVGITQAAGTSITQAATAGAATFSGGAGVITLDNTGNNFTGAVSLNNSGANNVALRDSTGGVILGTSSVGSGTLAVNATGITQAAGSSITQAATAGATTFNGGAGVITLANTGNNFTGAVGLSNSGNNNVSITDTDSLILGASNVGSGTLTVNAVGITQAAGSSITQAATAGAATFNAGAGVITLNNGGNDFTGAVGLNNSGANDVALRDSNAVILGTSSVGTGTLTVNATGITQAAGSSIVQAATAGAATFNAGAGVINLANANNNFRGPVNLSNSGGNNVAITDVDALILGDVGVGSGTLGVTAVGITQAAGTAITQSTGAGAATFNSGAGVITLANSNNNFRGAVNLTGGATQITDTNALTLGTLNTGALTAISTGALDLGSGSVNGNLLATSNGNAITQTGALTVTGTSGINAGVNGGDVTLDENNNDFQGAVSVTGGAVRITDANALSILALNNAANSEVALIARTGQLTLDASITNIDTGMADLTLSSGGSLTTPGTLSGTNVLLTGANGLTIGNDVTATGNLSLTSTTVGISQAAGTVITVGGTTTANAGAGSIALNQANNDFSGAVSLSNTGNGSVSVTDVDDIVFGTSSVGSGILTVNAVGITQAAGSTITQAAAAGAATFNGGAGVIALANAGNNFTGAVGLNNSGANNVSIADSNALILGTSSVGTGTLAVNAVGITQAAGATFTQAAGAGAATFNGGAGVITLTNAGNDFTGAVSLNNSGNNNVAITESDALILGTSSVGSGTLTVNAVGITQAAGTTIAQAAGAGAATFNAGAGVITLDNTGNNFTGAVVLNNSGANDVALRDSNGGVILGTSNVGTGALTVNATGITQAAGSSIVQAAGAGTASFNGGAGVINLANAGNNFTGTVALSNSGNNNVAITDSSALILGNVAVGSGTLDVTGVGITQDAATTIIQAAGAGAATFNAGAGVITLDNTGNDFTGAVGLNNSGNNNVSITDSNALVLGNSQVGSGTLTVTAVGITQVAGTAVVQAAGAGTATLDAGTGVLNLGNTGNDFTGSVVASGSSVSLRDANDLTVATATPGLNGSVSLIAGGNLTIPATGINTGTGDITLAANGGSLSTPGALTGANISLTGANGVTISDDITASSNLSLTSTTVGINQTNGSIVVAGTTTANAGAGSITLNQAGNDFGGAVSLSNSGNNNVSVSDIDDIVLGTSSVGTGTLTVNAVGITQAAASTITQAAGAGAATFNGGAGVIALANAGNNFTGAVGLNNSGANNVSITDSNALILGPSSVGTGTLTVNAVGITQAAGSTLVQAAGAGAATFNGGAGVITLANAGNNFTGAVGLNNSGANNVSITDSNALILGPSSVGSGTLTVNAVGITQAAGSALVQAAGAGAATFNGGAGVIALANAGNNFTGAVGLNNSGANNVSITDSNALTLGPSSVGTGTLTVNAVGITQAAGSTLVQAAGAGAATFNGGAGVITLANAGNNFTGAVGLNNSGNNNVSITDANALILGPSGVGSGTLTVNAVGITQAAGSTLVQAAGAGAATFNAGAGVITLANAGNDFTGAVGLNNSGNNNVSITDANALILGPSGVGTGTLTVNAVGITQAAGSTLVQAAGAGAATFNAGAGVITLANAGNDFTGAVGLSNSGNNNVAIADSNALILGNVSVGSGTLGVTAVGITQAAATTIVQAAGAGATSFNGGASPVTLANAGNDFTGVVSLTGGATQITDSNALTLGTLNTGNLTAISTGPLDLGGGTITGNLLATSNNGAITQTTALTVTGTSGLNAGTGTVSLGNSNNDFGGSVSASGSAITLADTNDLLLGNVTTAGTVALGSGAAITQSAGTVLTAGTLNSASVGATTLNNSNAITTLGAVTAAGLSVTNAQTLTVGGPIEGGASTTLTTTAGNLAINGAVNGTTTTLTSAGAISEGAGGRITAATLTGSSTGATTLNGANLIGTLGSFNAAGLSLTNAQTLTVAGPVNGGASTALTTTAGDLAINGAVSGAATTLTSAGAISEGAGGVITANTLTGSSTGATALNGANLISTLGSFTAAGLSVTNAQTLAVAGPVNGGASTTLTTTSGDLAINGAVNGTATTLTSAGAISEGAGGVITATTLTGSSTGATALNGANLIGTLGSFTAAGLSVTNAQTLTVAGPVNGGASTALTTTAGDLAINGAVSGATTTLTSAGAISEGAGGIITANTLTGSSTGATVLGGANLINTLGSFTAAGLTVNNAQALAVTGPVNGGATLALSTTSGNLTLNGAVAGTNTTLTSAGSISEGAGGVITATTLNGSSTGSTTLTGANRIGTLGSFTAAGLSVTNAQTLTVAGPVNGGASTTLTTTAGDLAINGAVNGTATTLISAGAISEGAGGIVTAATLTGSSTGATALNGANRIGTLGSFTAAGLSLTNAQTLTVAGPVNGGASTTLTTTAGDLAINGAVNGTATTLTSAGAISEGAGGVITAATLTGSSTGATALTGANRIGTLGSFTAAGLSVTNAQTLAVAGPVNGGASTTLTTTAGDLAINGAVNGTATTLTSAGAISEGAGGIVTATTLTGSSTGATALNGANRVGTLGSFTAAGLSLTNAQILTVAGPVNGGASTALTTTAGDLAINGAVNGTATTLTSAGAISEGAGGIVTAATLTGSSTGATTLTGANRIGTLGSFTAAGLSVTNAQTLTVAGPVNGGASTTLTTTAGDLAINGAVNGTATTLTSAGAISEGAGGIVTATTLTGSSTGATALTGANRIGTLGSFTAAGLSVTNAQTLTVAGPVNGGANTTLTTTAGDLAINGAVNGTATTLTSAGAISEGAGGIVTATTLTGSSTGATALTGANRIGTLGSFTAAGLSVTNAQALTVAGPVNGGASTTLRTTAGDLAINGAVTGTATTLTSAGAISEGASGVVTATTLTGSSTGATTLSGANRVGTLGSFTAGGFGLTNAQTLTVVGPVNGNAAVNLRTTTGNIVLNGNISGTSTSLISAGTLGGNGIITAPTLTGSSVGATTLNGANRIGTLNGFTAAGLSLTNAQSLTLAGTVNGGASSLLTTTGAGSSLFINGNLLGTRTTLNIAGDVMEGATGVLTAGTLTGTVGGMTFLGGADTARINNLIGTVGSFTSGGNFSLTNNQTLTLVSADPTRLVGGNTYSINAGTQDVLICVFNGDLLAQSNAVIYDGVGFFSATNRIGTASAAINIIGTGTQQVLGVPAILPAYFNAVDAFGNPLLVIGGFNVPTSASSARGQNSNNRRDGYIDPSLITANYRSYGVVPSGVRLPDDQKECDPDASDCGE